MLFAILLLLVLVGAGIGLATYLFARRVSYSEAELLQPAQIPLTQLFALQDYGFDETALSAATASLQQIIDTRYAEQSSPLIGHQTPMPDQQPAKITVLRDKNTAVNPEFSIVVPVHDQQDIIVENLSSYLVHTTGTYEVIVIADGCTDDTLPRITDFFRRVPFGKRYTQNLFRLLVIEQPTSVFEAAADNIGFLVARGRFVIEIQADMKMLQPGYNEALVQPMLLWPDVIGVSGRCAHNWQQSSGGIGKLGSMIEHRSPVPLEHLNRFWVYETCNRGPLALDRQKLALLGYLDEKNFPLAYDDHDLFARAWFQRQWCCGYVAIEFSAPLRHGSDRKPRSRHENENLRQRRARAGHGFLDETYARLKTTGEQPRKPVARLIDPLALLTAGGAGAALA